MNKSTNETGPTTAADSARQPAADPKALPSSDPVCYRMQPAKQMLSIDGCVHGCHAAPQEGPNKMPPCLLSDQQHSVIDLDRVSRVALMVTPQPTGDVIDEAWEAISTIRVILKQQPVPMTVTMQTVYVASAEEIESIRLLFDAYFGDRMPATSFIVQPPCGGQRLAIEAWALGGPDVDVQFPRPDIVTIAYDELRWIYLGGISSPAAETLVQKDQNESGDTLAYAQAEHSFQELAGRLDSVGATMNDIPRIWLYQGGITQSESGTERYRELNRARTDFFQQQQAAGRMTIHRDGHACYPASTGIGTGGDGLTLCCLGLQTDRDDVRLLPLENPRQTSAFDYAQRFSIKSPKFSRAMAVVIGDYVTTWVSGTASILDSESVHLGDIEKQTEQTIDNIQRLISPENFQRHGLSSAGAELADLAKVRVYVKRIEDYPKCRSVCERRFGDVPIIYALADICRPELLVEIEGVTFTNL